MSKFTEQEDSKKVTTLSDYEIQYPNESLLRPFVLKYRSTVVQVVDEEGGFDQRSIFILMLST
jgi:hypothetical protein